MLLDYLCYTSRLRLYHPRPKLLFTLAALLLCVVSRSIVISLVIAGFCAYLTIFIGGISRKHYLHLLLLPGFFLLTGCIALLFEISPQPPDIPVIGCFSWNYFSIWITKDSLFLTCQTAAVVLGSISCLYFLSLSTPVTDLLIAIRGKSGKRSGFRKILIELTLLTYRFIFLLLEIGNTMNVARKSRLGDRTFLLSCRSMGTLFAGLFLRAYQKSALLYDSMEARCYDGDLAFLENDYKEWKLWK